MANTDILDGLFRDIYGESWLTDWMNNATALATLYGIPDLVDEDLLMDIGL